MSIVIARTAAPAGPDGQLDVIVKLIPIEVLSIYSAARTLPGVTTPRAELVLLVVGLVLTPAILFLVSRHARRRADPWQYVVRTLAFVSWAFAVGAPLGAAAPTRWIPGLALIAIPFIGSYLFPPTGGGSTDTHHRALAPRRHL